MLEVKFIRENTDLVKKGAKKKGLSPDIDRLLGLDAERRGLLQEVEALKHTRNLANNEISALKKEGKDASAKIEEMKTVSQKIKEIDAKVADRGGRRPV